MVLDADSAYLALKARDTRFDGRLFVGVTSTGVYCRPVCRVRAPKRENCRFFDTRAQAEAAAFRPCMKCRPEIAPGLSLMDSSRSLADTAARAIEHAVHNGESLALPALAAKLGVTDRHLRRIFMATQGVSPHDYLSTQRLLLAKHLLTDTTQPITQVAMARASAYKARSSAVMAIGATVVVVMSFPLNRPLQRTWCAIWPCKNQSAKGGRGAHLSTLTGRRTLRGTLPDYGQGLLSRQGASG